MSEAQVTIGIIFWLTSRGIDFDVIVADRFVLETNSYAEKLAWAMKKEDTYSRTLLMLINALRV